MPTRSDFLPNAPADSNTTGAHYYEAAGQLFLGLSYEIHHSPRQSLSRISRITDEDDAAGLSRVGIDELAEIFVLCQENTLLTKGQVHDSYIIGPER